MEINATSLIENTKWGEGILMQKGRSSSLARLKSHIK